MRPANKQQSWQELTFHVRHTRSILGRVPRKLIICACVTMQEEGRMYPRVGRAQLCGYNKAQLYCAVLPTVHSTPHSTPHTTTLLPLQETSEDQRNVICTLGTLTHPRHE